MDIDLVMITSNKNSYWFVLFTEPQCEKAVNKNLIKKGIETFLPLRKEVRQWSDRKKVVEVSYFPNYLFVKIAPIDRYKVFEVPGIVRYLDSNTNPTVISEKEINIIKSLENENFEVTNENYAEGEWVSIKYGPMQHVEGRLIEKKGKKRLVVEIKSIKRNLLVDVSSCHIEKIPMLDDAEVLCEKN